MQQLSLLAEMIIFSQAHKRAKTAGNPYANAVYLHLVRDLLNNTSVNNDAAIEQLANDLNAVHTAIMAKFDLGGGH